MAVDYQKVRKHVYRRCNDMFTAFDRRKKILLETAREFKPLAVPGLELGVEQIADGWHFDEEHRMLTTIPVQILRKSASGFLANLTSPARQWFDLLSSKNGKMEHNVELALDKLREATEKTFQRSNGYAQCYKLFEDVMWAGFGCMIVSEDKENICKFQTLRIGTYALDIGKDGLVNRVARRFAWTPEQILETFGPDWTPEFVKELVRKASTKRLEMWNLIEPNPQGFNRKFDPIEKDGVQLIDESNEYRSFYFLRGSGQNDRRHGEKAGILSVAGYTHNPIIAPRLDYEHGDVYGMGRGIEGVYNARGVQTFKADELRIDGVRAQQPVVAVGDFKNRIQLGRKGVNITKQGDQVKDKVVPIFHTLPDASDTRQCLLESKEELEQLFYVDAFAIIDSQKNNPGVKTATEIEYLKTENLAKLGAITINLNIEMLEPMVRTVCKYTYEHDERTLTDEHRQTLEEAGVLSGLEIEYVSQIALAQKAGALTSVQQYIAFAGQLAGMKQDPTDNPADLLDTDATLKLVGQMLNVPEVVNKNEKDVAKKRDAISKAAANQQRMVETGALVDAAKNIGEIPIDNSHVGGALAEGLK